MRSFLQISKDKYTKLKCEQILVENTANLLKADAFST